MNKITYLMTFCLGTIGFFYNSAHVYAGQTIYQFKDTNGTTLLTNKKKAEYSHLKVVKATYYPDSNIHTYSNWGKTEASVLPSYSRNRNAFDHLIRQAAQQHGVSEGLIKAVMHTESGFNVRARSPVGAQGLMQLMPATARRFNVSDAYDPQQNIFAGARYLSWLLKRFNGNTELALAGYNAGEGNVDKYGGIPPFRETQDYVRRVTSRYQNLYASGLSSVTTNNALMAQSVSYSNADLPSNLSTSSPAPKQYNRQIITLADGTFTDAPAGTYSTANASASAHIRLSD
ncbi:lytic transglycosylase domain-containing protein [Acinetobacter haemolyticus]|uniref:Lytic transglycosylase domain-containing protein n=1 Tax=Acinetobacter haemolyticus TaxID=29430 RepID=A0A4P7B1X2_ACIHA|nr:lytic transglycosylase domain-containing protein [Acinetobacter haemolyticus]QBQ15532.1 lytic transglycosylase domain-containing protein [Acinetobacter haemolyticus]QHI09449.1 lytic transglycosylase domain-containing protein [Acinetobacter haemolyticus]QHI12713.1 lytic transglycosylase domain-containing protein [Acinetobacter haemolyticus]